jgi:hypothetical protein
LTPRNHTRVVLQFERAGPTNRATDDRISVYAAGNLSRSLAPLLQKTENIFLGALNSVDAVIARRDDATKSGRFTPDGVNNDVLQFALNQAVPVLKRGRDAIASAKQEAAALREKTKLREPGTGDPWKVGLMLRAVDRFAAMTQEQRNKLTINPDKLDPIEAEALVTAPLREFPRFIASYLWTVRCRHSTATRLLNYKRWSVR